jgi:uncharacterized protein
MAISAAEVLKTFDLSKVYHINVLTNITLLCDCWGISTPSLVPDIGILSSSDLVALDKASLDKVKVKDILPNSLPSHWQLRKGNHLFECVWGKDSYLQLDPMVKKGMGITDYEIEEIE